MGALLLKRMVQLVLLPDTEKGLKERKHLTTLSLACVIFFYVCGGPYGAEVSCACALLLYLCVRSIQYQFYEYHGALDLAW
jgi:hypothetical protein